MRVVTDNTKRKELPLPYVPIDPMLPESERFQRFVDLADLYDDPYSEFYIHKLLLFAGRARVDGNLGPVSARRLKEECRWPHEPKRLLNALSGAGWLIDDGNGGYTIEGWERHGGLVLERRREFREANRLRQKKWRCSKDGHPKKTCECPGQHGRP